MMLSIEKNNLEQIYKILNKIKIINNYNKCFQEELFKGYILQELF